MSRMIIIEKSSKSNRLLNTDRNRDQLPLGCRAFGGLGTHLSDLERMKGLVDLVATQ